jgi:hypothetical protein
MTILHPQGPDHPATFVGQEWVRDAIAVGELGEDVTGVVTDREHRDVVSCEIGERLLQLDELGAAERSPPGAALKRDQGATTSPDVMQIHDVSVLIRQDDVGKALSERWTDLREVDLGPGDLGHRCSFQRLVCQ